MTTRKRSIKISGHDTSVSLEDDFWNELKEIAALQNLSLNQLISEIDSSAINAKNLSSALRLYVLRALKDKIAKGKTTS